MGLLGKFTNLAGTAFGLLAGRSDALGTVGTLGSAFVAGTRMPSGGPSFPGFDGGFQPQPVMSFAPKVAGLAAPLALLVAPILVRIAAFLGRKALTLRESIKIIRRMGRVLGPAAIAAAIGISVADLAHLIMAASQVPTRRMNPGNVSALRRAHRRLESFHRVCQKNDELRSRGRRRPSRAVTGRPTVQITRAG